MIKNNNYEYYEILQKEGEKFFKIYDYNGDKTIFKKDNIITFFDNWDMSWNCDFIRVNKDNTILLRVI
jgi:hypothetical protein